MKTLKAPLLACLLASSALLVNLFAGCGSEENPAIVDPDASPDGSGLDQDGSTIVDSDGSSNLDGGGGGDGSLNDPDVGPCKGSGVGCSLSAECCTADCDNNKCAPPFDPDPDDAGTLPDGAPVPRPDGGVIRPGVCRLAGVACTLNTQCCQSSCVGGKCSNTQCRSTGNTCNDNGQCCTGFCSGGKCASTNGGQCKVKGEACGTGTPCCSGFCKAGLCSEASFCKQTNESCATNGECCGGSCVKPTGSQLGSCGNVTAPGVPQCSVKGTICTSPGTLCDTNCCSRVCAPNGSTGGNKICQPPSGCSPTGEICRVDKDCCGFGLPDKPSFCSKTAGAEFGRCDNGGSCREPGSICKAATAPTCGTENSCCAPDGENQSFCASDPANCCRRDRLGIPRCLMRAAPCTAAGVPANTACATSADCCGQPCVEGKCIGKGLCVDKGGKCSTSADCCTGQPCVLPTGSTVGLCGGVFLPDGGVAPPATTPDSGTGGTSDAGGTPPGTCALYGQSCGAGGGGAACCNGVPCIGNVCIYN